MFSKYKEIQIHLMQNVLSIFFCPPSSYWLFKCLLLWVFSVCFSILQFIMQLRRWKLLRFFLEKKNHLIYIFPKMNKQNLRYYTRNISESDRTNWSFVSTIIKWFEVEELHPFFIEFSKHRMDFTSTSASIAWRSVSIVSSPAGKEDNAFILLV